MTRMLKSLTTLALLSASTLMSNQAAAGLIDKDVSGSFNQDNDVALISFHLDAESTLTLFTSSWQMGGFDPVLQLWTAAGQYIDGNGDARSSGSVNVNGNARQYGEWDAFLSVTLGAGDYVISLVQYDNDRLGDTLGAGFLFDNDAFFTRLWGPHAAFNGQEGDQRGNQWQLHMVGLNVDTPVEDVPVPAPLALLGIGALALLRRRQTAQN